MTAVFVGTPILGKNPDVIPVSNSEIQTFKSCRRKWWLAYYRGLRPKMEKMTGPLRLGTRIHLCLELMYGDNQDPLEVHRNLIDTDRQLLLAEERDVTDLENEAELGRIMLEGYLEWLEESGADANLEVVGAEKRVNAHILNGKVEIKGKLDARVLRKADNVRLFMDHKTCQNFSDLTRSAHMDEQLYMYHLLEAMQPEEQERCDGGIFNMLRKVKRTATARPPFYERLEVRHNRYSLDAFWRRLHGTVTTMVAVRQALDDGNDPMVNCYPTPTRDCHWKCEFYAVCPLFDDGSAAEAMVDDFYTTSNPYDRYEETDLPKVTV